MPVAYVALGSNLGDKKAYLEDALSRMKVHGIKVQKVSTWIQTAPYGAVWIHVETFWTLMPCTFIRLRASSK